MIFLIHKMFFAIIRKSRVIGTTMLAKLIFKNIGANTKVYYNFYVSHVKNVSIGDNCTIEPDVRFISELADAVLTIKNNVKINQGVMLDFTGNLIIEEDVVISRNAYILTHSHGYDPRSKPLAKPLHIHKNVWIGANALIGENVSQIGENAIVAAGSIVTKDVPENTIVGGNPAKILKTR